MDMVHCETPEYLRPGLGDKIVTTCCVGISRFFSSARADPPASAHRTPTPTGCLA